MPLVWYAEVMEWKEDWSAAVLDHQGPGAVTKLMGSAFI